MSKLSMEALKERAEAEASIDLLTSISGGTENDCHPSAGEIIHDDEMRKAEENAEIFQRWEDNIRDWLGL